MPFSGMAGEKVNIWSPDKNNNITAIECEIKNILSYVLIYTFDILILGIKFLFFKNTVKILKFR